MSKLKDLTGMKFERLKVVQRHSENVANGNGAQNARSKKEQELFGEFAFRKEEM